MATPSFLNEEFLSRFLQEHSDHRVKRELLLFWGMHPNAKFSRFAICYAVDSNKLDMKMALRDMVEAKLLDARIYNSVTLYSLTTNEDIRRLLLALAALGWDRWQLMLRRAEQIDKVAKCQGGSFR